ncbi:MAG: hypothetical protein ACOX6E_07250 [Syntrophomonadaceae bacterium]|jgi:hypothetical protein
MEKNRQKNRDNNKLVNSKNNRIENNKDYKGMEFDDSPTKNRKK